MTVKEKILTEYPSVNNFLDTKHLEGKLKMSRTYLYTLINHTQNVNPTVAALIQLAELVGLSQEEVFNEYSAGHRDRQLSN